MFNIELFKDFTPVHENHHFIGAPASEVFPLIRIDMAHQEINLLLIITGKIRSFRDYSPYQCVVVFAMTLLAWIFWITIEHKGPALTVFIELYGSRIRKFAPSVSQNDMEELTVEFISKCFI